MPDQKSYKTNYLSDVILKINYPIVLELAKNLPIDFQKKISKDYPILEPLKLSDITLENRESEVISKRDDRTLWKFKSKDEKTIIELDYNSFAVITKSYTNYSNFKEVFKPVIDAFFEIYPGVVINRLGLRYINQIKLNEKDLFNWQEYIDKSLINNLSLFEDKNMIRRVMSLFELQIDDETKLRFQYGIFNSTFPNKLTNKEFILDYDCYTPITFEREKLEEKIKFFNDVSTNLFENSITSKFRAHLNA